MFKLMSNNKQDEVEKYCQQWLNHLSRQEFELADSLIDATNCYGLLWNKSYLLSVVRDYFNDTRAISFDGCKLKDCCPSFMEAKDGTLMLDFDLRINGELSDLTVQFEFILIEGNIYKVSIHDIHVL